MFIKKWIFIFQDIGNLPVSFTCMLCIIFIKWTEEKKQQLLLALEFLFISWFICQHYMARRDVLFIRNIFLITLPLGSSRLFRILHVMERVKGLIGKASHLRWVETVTIGRFRAHSGSIVEHDIKVLYQSFIHNIQLNEAILSNWTLYPTKKLITDQ